MAALNFELLAFIFGLLGNIISFLVFLAPLPTFYHICKNKSSDGFQAIPYSVALFSAALLLYYAFLKTNAYMIVSINGIGCVIESIYLFLFVLYASKKSRVFTIGLILIFNLGGICVIALFSMFLVEGPERVTLVGWICAAINIAVFAAPLSIMKQVIQTKSVEFMPFTLSLFLTLCATMWFFYGFFVKDFYIALPNVLGFLLGFAQMMLYCIYKNAKKPENYELDVDNKQQQQNNYSNKVGKSDQKPYTPTTIYKADSINGKEMELEGVICDR